MALVEVKVPQLSESVAEATLLQWKKKPGDAVAIDETLIEIETDKVVLEVPAPSAGVMAEIVKPDGSTVVAGDLIAKLDTDGKAAVPSEAESLPPPRRLPLRCRLRLRPTVRKAASRCLPPPRCWPTPECRRRKSPGPARMAASQKAM